MKFKGSLISQLSGKLGGLVAATAKGGLQYLRRRPSIAKAPSDLQVVVRAAMKTLSQRWSQVLTDAQRAGWETYAQNVARLDGQGNTIHISGAAWYVGNNMPRVNQNGSVASMTLDVIDDAPGSYDLGNPAAFEPGNCAITVDGAGYTISFNAATLPIAADTTQQSSLLVYASTPFAPGRANPVGPFNLVGAFNANNSSSTAYHGTLPANLVANSTAPKQDFSLRLSRLDGRLSSSFQVPANG